MERFPRRARLRSGAQIRRTLRRGRRHRAGTVDVFLADSPAARPRLAVVVPRHGRTLAERNRVKRRLREIARRCWLPRAYRSGDPTDMVMRARARAYRATFAELETPLRELFERLSSERDPIPGTGRTE